MSKVTPQLLIDTIRTQLEPVNQSLLNLKSAFTRNDQAIQQLADGLATNSKLISDVTQQLANELATNSKLISDVKTIFETKMIDLEKRVADLEAGPVESQALEERIKGLEEAKGNTMGAVYEELYQMEAREKNIAIFGLEEEGEPGETDEVRGGNLLKEIGAEAEFQCYRTGPKVAGRKRAVIMKFKTVEQKRKVLASAKNLKGKEEYRGITLSPDFTKQQRELSKKREAALKIEVEKRNETLSERQKNEEGMWMIWGRNEGRHLVKRKKNEN
jgi:hypothetical protein